MRLGLTTTVPTEPILAGGHTPVDLNNIFVGDSDSSRFIETAQSYGFPRTLCSWIKGQFAVILENDFDAVIAVTTGDCSNTHAMIELLEDEKIPVHRFSYPIVNNGRYAYEEMKQQLERLAAFLGVGMAEVHEQFERMHLLREKLARLDQMTVDGYVTGEENHLWMVCSSDFNRDIAKYEADIDRLISEASGRTPFNAGIRLGFAGVPPIITDLYSFAETKGAGFYFNEIQRQFTIPSLSGDIVTRYLEYTYPYDVFSRIEDIKKQVRIRRLDGIVHYVQSFCHRQVQDILMKKYVGVPVLTIEGDAPGPLDERSKIRMESFIEMLEDKKYRKRVK